MVVHGPYLVAEVKHNKQRAPFDMKAVAVAVVAVAAEVVVVVAAEVVVVVAAAWAELAVRLMGRPNGGSRLRG